jgi:hypothetical protein
VIDADTESALRQLRGLSVNRCIVDFAFTLHLTETTSGAGGEEEAYLCVAGPFEFGDGAVVLQCDPERDLAGLGPALTLFGRTVEAATIDDECTLRITFDGGAVVRIATGPQYEAWNLNVRDGALVIGGPGDRITTFPPEPTLTDRRS